MKAKLVYSDKNDAKVEEKKESEEKDDANMTAAEKKKLKHQQKREAKSKEKQEGGSKTDDNSAGPKVEQVDPTIVLDDGKNCV